MKIRRNIIFWLVFSIVLIFFDGMGYIGFIKIPLVTYAFSIKQPIYGLGVDFKNWLKFIRNIPKTEKLSQENEKLKTENGDVTYKNKMLVLENELLKKQLGSPIVSEYKYIPAHVLGLSRMMDLSVGEIDGVKKGMPVINGSVVIGRIGNVSKYRSQVLLITDAELKITAKTLRGAKGTVNGQFENNISFGEILQKDPLFLEDEVLTDGMDGMPYNLILGKIIYIKSDDVSVYKQAKLDYPVDLKKLEMVFVVSEFK
jgi:rod shape-determining protein MreC